MRLDADAQLTTDAGATYIDLRLIGLARVMSKGMLVELVFSLSDEQNVALIPLDRQQVAVKIPSLFTDPIVGHLRYTPSRNEWRVTLAS